MRKKRTANYSAGIEEVEGMTGTRKEHGPRGIDRKHYGSVLMVTEPGQSV